MKAINRYIIVDKIKTEPKKVAGLIMTDDTVADLAFLVGAKVINEQLGDDLDLIDVDCLGEAYSAITDDKNTV